MNLKKRFALILSVCLCLSIVSGCSLSGEVRPDEGLTLPVFSVETDSVSTEWTTDWIDTEENFSETDRSFLSSSSEDWESEGFLLPLSPSNAPGRMYLASLPEGEILVQAYDRIAEGVARMTETVDLSDLPGEVPEHRITTVYGCYSDDYPQQFWISSKYSYSHIGDRVTKVTPQYRLSGAETKDAILRFRKASEEILAGISSDMSDYEKEKTIHDRLIARCEYGQSDFCHTAYGALVEGVAVCDGYSKAFHYLCREVGLSVQRLHGMASDPETGELSGHSWVAIRLEGEWYQTDVTWDDGESVRYAYFNLTGEQMAEDHVLSEDSYGVPECRGTKYHYYRMKGAMVSEFSAEQLADLIRNGNGSCSVWISGDLDAYQKALDESYDEIAEKLGLSGYHYMSSSLGREVFISLTGEQR